MTNDEIVARRYEEYKVADDIYDATIEGISVAYHGALAAVTSSELDDAARLSIYEKIIKVRNHAIRKAQREHYSATNKGEPK